MDERENAPPQETRNRRQRLLILGICCLSLLIVGLDSTIVNVALPSIRNDLHASVSGLQWVIDAYTLVLASLLMLSGSTADRIGRKRVFQTGLVVFSLGSLLCGVAPTLELLIAFRVRPGDRRIDAEPGGDVDHPQRVRRPARARDGDRHVGRGVRAEHRARPGPRRRPRRLGRVALGVLRERPDRSGRVRADRRARARVAGRAPSAARPGRAAARDRRAGLADVRDHRGSPRRLDLAGILALFAFSLASFVALVLYELRRREPLVEMRFFRSAPFSGASTIAICAFAALGGFLFLNTLYLQGVRHLSPFHAGLYLLPMAAMVLVCAPLSGRIVGRRGARIPLVIASCALIVSSLMLTRLTPTTAPAYLLVAYFLFGIGSGMINPPITNTAVSGMPGSQAGVAAAIASTSRSVGLTLGVAVIGAIAGGTLSGAIEPSFAAATHAGWWVMAGLGVVSLIVGLLTTTAWARDTARRTAERFRESPGRGRYAQRELAPG